MDNEPFSVADTSSILKQKPSKISDPLESEEFKNRAKKGLK